MVLTGLGVYLLAIAIAIVLPILLHARRQASAVWHTHLPRHRCRC